MDNRHVCINCEFYKPFKGVYECWNRDSDMMYRPTLPDDDCPEFEKREEREDDR